MNQKRSRNRNQLTDSENNRIARHQSQVKHFKRSPRTLLTRSWCCSYFYRGLVWGVIVGFTAVFSALGGSALTQIESVEKAIARTIEADPSQKRSPESSLTRPLNVLLIEAVADPDAIAEPAPLGRDSKLLLLRLEPQLDYAQIINIPLDSSVYLPGYGRGIVRDADRLGGTQLLTQVVSQSVGMKVNRYVRTSPEVVRRLLASGAIVPDECRPRPECIDKIEQITRQQTLLETIRQRLKVPYHSTKFQKTLLATQPDIDTNLSLTNLLSMAYFVRELEPDSINVDILSKYVPGKTIADRRSPFSLERESSEAKIIANNPQHNSVAVQNTTNNPELGMRVVAYLRQQNFRDVYLVEHLPLKLERTRIVAPRSQEAAANRIQKVLGFGNLKAVSRQQKLILQIGKDARNLPLNY